MANNWSSGWFTIEWAGSVEQSSPEVSYDISSFLVDETTPTWYIRFDGTTNTWFPIEDTIESLSSVSKDQNASYNILYPVFATSVALTWDIDSTSGAISGTPELPFASAEADASFAYEIFFASAPSADKTGTYRILTYAEDISQATYRILNSAQADTTCTYNSAGYVQDDEEFVWDVFAPVERDQVGSYNVKNFAEASSVVTYTIITSPLSAGDNREVSYTILNAAVAEYELIYDVLNSAEKDSTLSFKILTKAEQDSTHTYNVLGPASREATVTYQLNGTIKVTQDQTIAYNVLSLVGVVPNVVGYPLQKATTLIESSGFELGQITYQ